MFLYYIASSLFSFLPRKMLIYCCYNCIVFYTHCYVIILVLAYVINYNINYHILMLHFIL